MYEEKIKKSVRKALHSEIPRYPQWRAHYRLADEEPGFIDFRKEFGNAYAEFDVKTGECKSVTVFEPDTAAYYATYPNDTPLDGVLNITHLVERWMRNENRMPGKEHREWLVNELSSLLSKTRARLEKT